MRGLRTARTRLGLNLARARFIIIVVISRGLRVRAGSVSFAKDKSRPRRR